MLTAAMRDKIIYWMDCEHAFGIEVDRIY